MLQILTNVDKVDIVDIVDIVDNWWQSKPSH